MTNFNNKPEILLRTKRDDIVDCDYFGSIYIANKNEIIIKKGYSKEEWFFMRSLAKPLQASIISDYNIQKDLDIKPYELAIMTGSHAGSPKHIKLLKDICKKYKIKLSELELIAQNPLDTRKFNGKATKLHNNCSGKHILMVLMCKYLGLDIKNYTNPNHPIQQMIMKKQEELSENKAGNLSFDGCGTPLWAINIEGLAKAYFNLFHDKKYKSIVDSALKYPDIFGGYNRLDTEIIKTGKNNLYAKVGANGFLLVYNFKEDKIFILKITQNNNPIRRLIAFNFMNKSGWTNVDLPEYEYNQKNIPVAKYCYEIE